MIVSLAAVVLAGGFAAARMPREREREAADALAKSVRETPPKVLVEHPRRAPAALLSAHAHDGLDGASRLRIGNRLIDLLERAAAVGRLIPSVGVRSL